MRNLSAIQEALRITRSSLAAFCERFLRAEFGENWWKYGIAACVQQDYDERGINKTFPETGDAGDLDLQLLLKLINVYHWDRITESIAWSQKERGLVSALINIRNLYEGHVTPNRERELDTPRTVEILDGIHDFNRLISPPAAEKIMTIIKKVEAPIIKREPKPQIEEADPIPEPEPTYVEPASPPRFKEINGTRSDGTPPVSKRTAPRKKPVFYEEEEYVPQEQEELTYYRSIDEIEDEKKAKKPAPKRTVKKPVEPDTRDELEYTPIRKGRNYVAAESKAKPARIAPKRKKVRKNQKVVYLNVKRIGFITILVLLVTIALVLLEKILSAAAGYIG